MNKPTARIKLRSDSLSGDGVKPETTAVGDLSKFLIEIEAAVIETAQFQRLELPKDEAIVSAIQFSEGSNIITLALFSGALVAYATVTQAIGSGDYDMLPYKSQVALNNISKQSATKGWCVDFIPDLDQSIREATISKEHPVPAPTPKVIRGNTTIYGRCIRVGGKVPKVDIQLDDGSTMHIEVPHLVARSFGPRIYDTIGMEGEATWDAETWQLKDFKFERVVEIRNSDPVRGFEELSRASAGHWDGVDVEGLIASLRREDGE